MVRGFSATIKAMSATTDDSDVAAAGTPPGGHGSAPARVAAPGRRWWEVRRNLVLLALVAVAGALFFRWMRNDHGLFELPGRSAEAITDATLPRNALQLVVMDMVFAALFAMILALLVGRNRGWRPLAFFTIGMYFLADEVENRSLYEIVRAKRRSGGPAITTDAARELSTASAAKWGFLCAALLGLAASWYVRLPRRADDPKTWGRWWLKAPDRWGGRRRERDPRWHGPANRGRLDAEGVINEWLPDARRFGVALSGGGIRSASFSLGVIQELRTRGLLGKARYLASVSGGGYTATAFTAMNQPRVDSSGATVPPIAELEQWHENSPEEQALRRSLRYFATSNGVMVAAVGRILFGLFVNLVLLYLLLFAVVRPVGWFIGSGAVAPGLRVQQPVATKVLSPDARRCRDLGPDVGRKLISIVDAVEVSPSVTTRRYEVALAAPTQCIALVSPPSITERTKSIRLEMIRPAVVVVENGKARIERQATMAARWCTADECPGAPATYPAGDVVAGLVRVIQPTISLRPDAVGIGPAEPITQFLVVDDAGPRRLVAPVSILDRRDDERSRRSAFGPAAAAFVIALVLMVYRVGRRPHSYRTFNRWALRFALVGAALLLVWWLLPAAVESIPRAISKAANAGPSPASRPKLFGFDLPPSSLSNLLAFLVLGVRSVQRQFGSGKSANAAATSRPVQSNARAFTKKATRFLTRAVIGLGLLAVAAVNILTILTVGALNGPKGRFTWLSDMVWGDLLVGRLPPDYTLWIVVVFLLLATVSFTEAVSWSMAPIYRRRLTYGFAWSRVGSAAERRPYGRAEAVHSESTLDHPLTEEQVAASLAWQDLTAGTTGGFAGGFAGEGTEHVLCCAVNVRGENRTPTARKAVSFSASRSYIGSPEIGWMDTKTYRSKMALRRGWDVSLPGLMATSGAAASPGMGRSDLGAAGSVLAILNVRLGAWLPNPGWVASVGEGAWRHLPGWQWFVREVFRRFDPQAPYLYVTDGGHWENLGLVELLRRGCANIIVVSAAGDGLYSNSTFASAVEIARTDLGVEIDIDAVWNTRPLLSDAPGPLPSGREYLLGAGGETPLVGRTAPNGFAFGTIRFPIEPGSPEGTDRVIGTILLIEASMVDGLPADVHAYAEKHPEFPNVSTGDQFFTDEDFEAYRVLGRTLVRQALGGSRGLHFDDTITDPATGCTRADPTSAPSG